MNTATNWIIVIVIIIIIIIIIHLLIVAFPACPGMLYDSSYLTGIATSYGMGLESCFGSYLF